MNLSGNGQPYVDPTTGQWYDGNGNPIPGPTGAPQGVPGQAPQTPVAQTPTYGPGTPSPGLVQFVNQNTNPITPYGGTAYAGPVLGPTAAPAASSPVDTSGGGGGSLPNGLTVGSLLQAYPGGPPNPSLAPGYQPPAPFSYAAFTPPTAADVTSEPGYAFRLQQGEGALQNQQAASGLLNSGTTLQDILAYGQNYASNEYQNAYNRDLSTYGTNYAAALGNYNVNVQNQNVQPYNAAFQNAGFNNTALNNQYLEAYNQFRNRQLDTYNELYGLSQLATPAATA